MIENQNVPNHPELYTDPVTPLTIGNLLGAVNEKVGRLRTFPTGQRYAEYIGEWDGDESKFSVAQIPPGNGTAGDAPHSVAVIGVKPAKLPESVSGGDKNIYYSFILTGDGTKLVKSFGVDPLPTADYRKPDGTLDNEAHEEATENHRTSISAETRAMGMDIVYEDEALKLLTAVKESKLDIGKRKIRWFAERIHRQNFEDDPPSFVRRLGKIAMKLIDLAIFPKYDQTDEQSKDEEA